MVLKRNLSITAAALGVLTGCATTTPRWTASGAQPFNEALSQCHERLGVIANQQEREAALENCTAKGLDASVANVLSSARTLDLAVF